MSEGLISGKWLDQDLFGNDCFIQSVITATVWFIWKARCNKIFKGEDLNYLNVSTRAIGHAREFLFSSSCQLKNNSIINNFTIADSPILLVASICSAETTTAGLSFILSDSNSKVLCSGCCGCSASSVVNAAAKALCFASQVRLNINVKTILSSNSELIEAIKYRVWSEDWRLNYQLQVLKDHLAEKGSPSIHSIPMSWSKALSSLACFGLTHHEVSLFLCGRDLPRWLMKIFSSNGFSWF